MFSRIYWIRSNYPEISELEVRLEFISLLSYEKDKITEEHWKHFKSVMEDRIRLMIDFIYGSGESHSHGEVSFVS